MDYFNKETIAAAIKYAIFNNKFNMCYHLSDDYILTISGGDYESTVTLSNNNGDLIAVFYVPHYTNSWEWAFNKGEVIQKIADRIYEKYN